MAITKTILYNFVSINDTAYSPFLANSAVVTITPVSQTVKNGQTLTAAWDVNFTVDFLDTEVIFREDVYTDPGKVLVLTNIAFDGSPDAAELLLTNVFIHAVPNFEGERVAYTITGTKRITKLPINPDQLVF